MITLWSKAGLSRSKGSDSGVRHDGVVTAPEGPRIPTDVGASIGSGQLTDIKQQKFGGFVTSG